VGSSWRWTACDGEWSLIISLAPSFIPVGMGGGRPPRRRRKGPSDAWRVALHGVVRAGRPWLASMVASPTGMTDLSTTVAAGGGDGAKLRRG
jgi:hypothetical protein